MPKVHIKGHKGHFNWKTACAKAKYKCEIIKWILLMDQMWYNFGMNSSSRRMYLCGVNLRCCFRLRCFYLCWILCGFMLVYVLISTKLIWFMADLMKTQVSPETLRSHARGGFTGHWRVWRSQRSWEYRPFSSVKRGWEITIITMPLTQSQVLMACTGNKFSSVQFSPFMEMHAVHE